MSEELTYALVVDERVQKAVLKATRRFTLRSRRFLGLVAFAIVLAAVMGAGIGSWFEGAFAGAVMLVGLFVVTARAVWTGIERIYPLGATVTATYGEHEVAFRGGTLPTTRPYAELGEPTVRTEMVIFPSPTAPSRAWIVPVGLCPPEARARITGPAAARVAADGDPRFTRIFVAGDDTARKVGTAVTRRIRLSGRGLRMSLLGLVSIVLLVAVTGDLRWFALVLVFLGAELWGLRATRNGCARLFPPGSTISAGFTPNGLVVRFPVAVQEWSLADFGDIWWNEDAVVLRDRVQRQCTYAMPRGLFSDEDLVHLRNGIAAARPVAG
ncbi:hypothetical protein [Marmoricola sp. RAF53]|uniref:hypothetical protein n=1 Tax=Marmoricola sp. RAF53 TaxID=3233059 RepID=UPI003F99585F